MSIKLPESHKFLAGDYMRENPMYSEREVRELIAAEREECAKVCESLCKEQHGWNSFSYTIAVNDCADAIRARGEE